MNNTTIAGIDVVLYRKRIKHVYIKIVPPYGQVRVSAPLQAKQAMIETVIAQKREWIKQKQQKVISQSYQPQYESDNTHCYLWGQRYQLEIVEKHGKHCVIAKTSDHLQLCVTQQTTLANRERVLSMWYRQQLHDRITQLLIDWQPIIGVTVESWGSKKMKTRWGSCNIRCKRIWLNLELIKRPPQCLEYVLVHELVHLLERYHNKRFYGFMDQFMPDWRQHKAVLDGFSFV